MTDTPKQWSAIRNLFVREAERFMNATRYEEASAIADKAARDLEALAASPAPDLEGLRERVARIVDHEGYWERLDNLRLAIRSGAARTDDQQMELCHARDEELAGTEESLAKADAILSLIFPEGEGRSPD